jgi:prepilin-type N-terminal cleavage/methylation domain-containing protein
MKRGLIFSMKNQRGFTLLDVLVSLAIFSILSGGFLSALIDSTKAVISVDQRDSGRALAQSQMEYIKEQDFASSYSANDSILSGYPGYEIDSIVVATPTERDALIQEITINVSQNGILVTSLEDFKVKR